MPEYRDVTALLERGYESLQPMAGGEVSGPVLQNAGIEPAPAVRPDPAPQSPAQEWIMKGPGE